jgi:hypothetical protein
VVVRWLGSRKSGDGRHVAEERELRLWIARTNDSGVRHAASVRGGGPQNLPRRLPNRPRIRGYGSRTRSKWTIDWSRDVFRRPEIASEGVAFGRSRRSSAESGLLKHQSDHADVADAGSESVSAALRAPRTGERRCPAGSPRRRRVRGPDRGSERDTDALCEVRPEQRQSVSARGDRGPKVVVPSLLSTRWNRIV